VRVRVRLTLANFVKRAPRRRHASDEWPYARAPPRSSSWSIGSKAPPVAERRVPSDRPTQPAPAPAPPTKKPPRDRSADATRPVPAVLPSPHRRVVEINPDDDHDPRRE
jgi:hypothetical protein